MSYKTILYCSFFLIFSTGLSAQSDLDFSYEKFSEFYTISSLDIDIRFPNGNIEKIYSGTDSVISQEINDFFVDPGDYGLLVSFESDSVSDSVDLNFSLDGDEVNVGIRVSFSVNNKYVINNWSPPKIFKVPRGYLSIKRYYDSIEGISVNYEDIEPGDGYKEPLFRLTNNSKQTIYGEYMPGYFWGGLYYGLPDSTWGKKMYGPINFNFVDLPPLSPDSSKIATVGSLGLFDELYSGTYKYELFYSLTGNTNRYEKYREKGNFEWSTNKADLYVIDYIFKIE